ncbi:unnamed protein product [Polarella glacialis]|uniref:Xaa-Pro dipeptidyl-peptidase C-terminal domain-containing protein n=1 Tax=Polarella glacialis TaxID=89957 RepID=A0A813FVH6_POLGL|nr:unnamed protein product [Polarella glacialis]
MRRDLMGTNGIDDLGFGAFWWNTEVLPAITGLDMKKKDELFRKTMRARPADWTSHEDADEIFANINVGLGPKDFEKMSTPMLLCLSFSDHGMHTQGSSRCWRNSTNLKERWPYTHRTRKWDSYYSDEVHEMTLKFMDHYLKGKDNGWEKTPPVRLEVRSAKDVIHEVRYEQAFPLPDTQYIKLFPTTAGMLKEGSSGGDTGGKTYSGSGGSLRFTYTFAEPTETTGYFKTVLEAEARDGSPDMCVFVNVFKLDKKGENVPFYGSVGSRIDGVTRGIMRASFRALDPERSTEYNPEISFKKQPFKCGEKMLLEIDLCATSCFFDQGESLVLSVASKEVISSQPYVKSTHGNCGSHVIHMGKSYLQVPKIVKKR